MSAHISMNSVVDHPSSRPEPALLSFGVFRAAFLALCGITILFLLISAKRYLPAVGDTTYPEAAGVLSAQRYAQGLGLYGDFRVPPYLLTPYAPLWYVLLAVPAWLGVRDLDTLTFLGRLLALICTFGVAALGYLWNRRIGNAPRMAVFTPALFLSVPILIPWAMTARPDLPALFCSMLAIYLCARRANAVTVAGAALMCAAAFLIRHSAVALPVAVVLWLLWSRRWQHAFVFCSVWAAAVGVTAAAFQVSSGGMLLLNLSGASFGRMAFTYSRDIILRLLAAPGQGMITALIAIGFLGFVSKQSDPSGRTVLAKVYFATSLGLAGLGSAAAGAALNHFFEPALAMALLAPAAFTRLEEAWRRDTAVSGFAAILLAVLLVPSLDVQRWNVMHEGPADMGRLLPYAAGKTVFTDIPYLAARSATLETVDLPSLTNAARAKKWSPAVLIEGLEKKRYERVILEAVAMTPYDPAALYPRYPRIDPAVRNAVLQNYNLCFELSGVNVYSPLGAKCN